MKVSELVTLARSVSNIDSTQAISHDDEDQFSNNSWKDIYARILDQDDDYFTKSVTFPTLLAYATVNPNEYMIPLPEDFYKLRFIDYQPGSTGTWNEMHKFSLSLRNDQPAVPHYRFDSANLWVVGANVSQVRIHYYPTPAELTHPDTDLQYATAVTPNNFNLISSPVYATSKNTAVYIYNAQNIVEGSIDDHTVAAPVTLLAAGANLTSLVYYKGYLYWVQAADIKRAPTDLFTSPIVPAAVTAVGTVLGFQIDHGTIFYYTAAAIRSCTLTGGSDSLVAALIATSVCSTSDGSVYFTEATSLHLHKFGVATILDTNTTKVTTDGTDLFVLHVNGTLTKVSGSSTNATIGTLRTDIAFMGPWFGNRLPVLTNEGQMILAISALVDTDITYPSNIVTNIVAYQMAIDFCTKLGRDFTAIKVRLGDPDTIPATGLWASFKHLIRRDDYEPERIKNSRSANSGMGML